MRTLRTPRMLSVLLLTVLGVAVLAAPTAARADEPEAKLISHMVYFSLKTKTPEAKKKLIAACKEYLAGHEGTLFFAAGVMGEEFKRPVNDTDYDVALILVFVNKAAHDKYQDHPRHLKFIEVGKDNWEKVRVFDSVVSP